METRGCTGLCGQRPTGRRPLPAVLVELHQRAQCWGVTYSKQEPPSQAPRKASKHPISPCAREFTAGVPRTRGFCSLLPGRDPAGCTGVMVSTLRSQRAPDAQVTKRASGLWGRGGLQASMLVGRLGGTGPSPAARARPASRQTWSVRQTQGPWAVPSQVVALASAFGLTDL